MSIVISSVKIIIIVDIMKLEMFQLHYYHNVWKKACSMPDWTGFVSAFVKVLDLLVWACFSLFLLVYSWSDVIDGENYKYLKEI